MIEKKKSMSITVSIVEDDASAQNCPPKNRWWS